MSLYKVTVVYEIESDASIEDLIEVFENDAQPEVTMEAGTENAGEFEYIVHKADVTADETAVLEY